MQPELQKQDTIIYFLDPCLQITVLSFKYTDYKKFN